MLSFKKKIFIDRAIGAPIAFFLNTITMLIGMILRRDHGLPQSPKEIIVAKILGMGSILQSGVICRALKKTFPGVRITYITSRENIPLLSRMKYVDEFITIDESSIFKMIVSACLVVLKLWKIKPELYFDLEIYSSWSSILATLSLARNRYGFFRKSTFFKLGLHSHLLFFNTAQHIGDIYLMLGRAANAEGDNNIEGMIQIRQEDRDECGQLLDKLGINKKQYLVVSINASELLLERRWPIVKWKYVLENVTSLWPDLFCLLAGSPSERQFVSQLEDNLVAEARQKVINIAGQLSLSGYFALIEGALAMITVDSGPMHIAVSLGVPTLSLWGPGQPQHYATAAQNHRIIYQPIFCSPCLYHADFPPCNGDNQCMKRISTSQVLTELSQLIGRPIQKQVEAVNHLKVGQEIETLLGLVKRPGIKQSRNEQLR